MSSNDWRERALCAALPEDIQSYFFAEKDSRKVRSAQGICFECDVRDSCLSYAVRMRLTAGVFGGMQPEDREAIGRSKSFSKKREVVEHVRAEVALFTKHNDTT